MPEQRYKVLFLDGDNTVHSVMAEVLLKRWGGDDFRAFSAGIRPTGVIDPRTSELLQEQRILPGDLRGKSHREFLKPDAPLMDFVITLGECPPEGAPAQWPGNPQVMHWHITTPGASRKSAEVANAFRRVFTELEMRIKLFVLVYEKERVKRAA